MTPGYVFSFYCYNFFSFAVPSLFEAHTCPNASLLQCSGYLLDDKEEVLTLEII